MLIYKDMCKCLYSVCGRRLGSSLCQSLELGLHIFCGELHESVLVIESLARSDDPLEEALCTGIERTVGKTEVLHRDDVLRLLLQQTESLVEVACLQCLLHLRLHLERKYGDALLQVACLRVVEVSHIVECEALSVLVDGVEQIEVIARNLVAPYL